MYRANKKQNGGKVSTALIVLTFIFGGIVTGVLALECLYIINRDRSIKHVNLTYAGMWIPIALALFSSILFFGYVSIAAFAVLDVVFGIILFLSTKKGVKTTKNIGRPAMATIIIVFLAVAVLPAVLYSLGIFPPTGNITQTLEPAGSAVLPVANSTGEFYYEEFSLSRGATVTLSYLSNMSIISGVISGARLSDLLNMTNFTFSQLSYYQEETGISGTINVTLTSGTYAIILINENSQPAQVSISELNITT